MTRAARRGSLAALVLASLALWCSRGDAPAIRVATFNIEMFPSMRTDRVEVAHAIAELDAEVIALQEIVDAAAMRAVLVAASQAHGRDYRLVPGACGGDGRHVTTAVVFDDSRVDLVAARSYPGLDPGGRGACTEELAATLVVVAKDDERLAVLSVHLRPFPENFDERRKQWPKVLRILDDAAREHDAVALAVGDYNTTGFTTKPSEEREFVERVVDDAGMELLTGALPCTEYWQPVPPFSDVLPSLLDHVVARGGTWHAPTVAGYCAELACRPTTRVAMDPRWRSVSDHCPVVVDGVL